jgi:hypothetical protein
LERLRLRGIGLTYGPATTKEKDMAIKNTMTLKPVRYKKDKKGNLIPVYRSGQRDTNKYAKLTPREKRDARHVNDKGYDPTKPQKEK